MGNQLWISDGEKFRQLRCTKVLSDPVDVAYREMSGLLHGFHNLHGGGIPPVMITEFFEPTEPRTNDAAFDLQMAKEIGGLALE